MVKEQNIDIKTNELLEEIWETRRKIEAEKQENLETLLTRFQKRQQQYPSR